MSDASVQVAKRWFEEVWNQQRAATIHELLHPQAKGHTATAETTGPDEWKRAMWDVLTGAFSEIRIEILDLVAEGESVVARWRVTMRHTGPHMGVPETGRALDFTGMTWLVIRNGQIVEGWDGWDSTGMLVSIGGAQLHPNLSGQPARH
jgi:predicted ester cyclase